MTDSNYIASESVAVVRCRRPGDRDRDSLAWLPVFLCEPDHEPFVKLDGKCCAVRALPNFERYEKVQPRKRKLYDTATGKMVQV